MMRALVCLLIVPCLCKRLNTKEDKLVRCAITGPKGLAASWAVSKKSCRTQCVRHVDLNNGEVQIQEDHKFSRAFVTSVLAERQRCLCSVNGEARVQYPLLDADPTAACADGTEAAQMKCWTTYKVLKDIELKQEGSLLIVRPGKELKTQSAFQLEQHCDEPCVEDSCDAVSIPSVVSHIPDALKASLKETLEKKIADGKLRGIWADLEGDLVSKDLIDMLFSKLKKEEEKTSLSKEQVLEAFPISAEKLEPYWQKVTQDSESAELDADQFQRLMFMLRSVKKVVPLGDGQFQVSCVDVESNEPGECLDEDELGMAGTMEDCLNEGSVAKDMPPL